MTEPGDEEAVLGCVSLFDVDADDARAATGYWLAAHGRGRGAATHAVRLLTGLGASRRSASPRIELTLRAGQRAPPRRSPSAAASRARGVLRSHMAFKGGRRDTVVYGLLAGER